MYYISIMIVIIGNVVYTFFQDFIPDSVNPLIALCCMYAGALAASIFAYLKHKKDHTGNLKGHIEWRVIVFALINIAIDLGYLLAFRWGWELSMLNVVVNITVSIILTIVGTMFFREKLSLLNIMGIILGVFGLSLLSI